MSLIRKETVENDGNKYEYSLYVNESKSVASFRLPLYSVKIILTLKNGKETEYFARDLFCDTKIAISFFEMLVDKLATPMNLPYIIEDTLYA